MNKKIEITKNIKILSFLNLLLFFSLFVFDMIYKKINIIYYFFPFNIIIFVAYFLITIYVLKNKKDTKRNILYFILIIILYIFINTILVFSLNIIINSKYNKITNIIKRYCITNKCSKYEVTNYKGRKKFLFTNKYIDSNNFENKVEVYIIYNTKEIESINANVYSYPEYFSSYDIKKELNIFEYNNINISENLIDDAFNNRFVGSVGSKKMKYRVKELYEDDVLTKLKSSIRYKK